MTPRPLRMSGDPHGHGSGRPNVTQRPRDRSAGRDAPASDLVDAFLESPPKVDVHNRISTRVHNTFPFRGFALAVASKTLSTKSSHRRATHVLGEIGRASCRERV